MSNRQEDRWLLPRRQTEYPARDLVSEVNLHARREATFLVLSTLFTVTLVVLLLTGTGRLIDVGELIGSAAPDIELPVALHVPFGALPAAFGGLALLLACELYGRRRASALLWAGGFTAVALVGLARLGDVIDGHDAALLPTAALAAGALVTHAIGLVVFAGLRRRLGGRRPIVRALTASLIAQPAGWAAFAGMVYAAQAAPDVDALAAIGLGATAFTLASVLALALPLAIAARALSVFLRVARFEDTSDARVMPAPVAERASRQSLSPVEMRFFSEGDQLEAAAEA
jgi:hypothetical protein